ncbi:MAG: hypothetical protein WBQ94_28155 [Terracidiphilus sp.]
MTARRSHGLLLLLICTAALSGTLSAQTAQTTKTITVRMLDAKTGAPIATSDFLVRVDRKQDQHGNWVQLNDDGSGKVTLPVDATLVTFEAKYNEATDIYVNCDSVRDKPIPMPHWYAISEILTSGVAAPNGCSKHTAVAKPGELVFFVRKRNWQEQFKDYSQ